MGQKQFKQQLRQSLLEPMLSKLKSLMQNYHVQLHRRNVKFRFIKDSFKNYISNKNEFFVRFSTGATPVRSKIEGKI